MPGWHQAQGSREASSVERTSPRTIRSSTSVKRLLRHMQGAKGVPHVEAIVDKALLAAAEQTVSIPGERMTVCLVRELAAEALAARAKLAELDRELEETLVRPPLTGVVLG